MPLGHRLFLIFTLACTGALASPATGSADEAIFGVRGGYYTKVEQPFLGAEFLIRLAPRLYFNPNLEYVFVDNGKYMTFNADAHYDLPTHSHRTFVWLGAGLAIVRIDPDGPRKSTDAAANFFAGAGWKSGGVIPYFQAKLIAKSDTEFVLAFGLRF